MLHGHSGCVGASASPGPHITSQRSDMQGLRVGGYNFDTDEYWDFIRGGREEYLKPDPKVQAPCS